MGFSDNLCNLLNERHMSRYRLAKTLGVHVSTVTNWLNGATPKIDVLQKLAQEFNVSLEQLLEKSS